jgi:ADP-dependent NAD(P)H-hydrate dehydratase / NAD(P)H-hydrate epimerase
MKIVTVEQMRRIEQDSVKEGISIAALMENAGKATAEEIKRITGSIDKQRVVVLIGPGNNGGDGLVAARHLHDWGAGVSVFLLTERPAGDSNLSLVLERNIPNIKAAEDENQARLDTLLASATVVVDAIFGTGKSRALSGIFAQGLERVTKAREKQKNLQIFALDLPSGLDADTGAVDPACVNADYTIMLGFPKVGLFNPPGAEKAGKISIVDIGLPPNLADDIQIELITPDWVGSALPRRPLLANKGTFGKALVIAGSIYYIGAAYLACSGAIRAGAGLVTMATPAGLQPILASKLTEVTYLPLPESSHGVISAESAKLAREQTNGYDAVLVGCGLGQSQSALAFIKSFLLHWELQRLVIDADGLNNLSKVPEWWKKLTADAILTPHPGEMARLLGTNIEEVQKDRIGTARKAAVEWNKTVVLKGA